MSLRLLLVSGVVYRHSFAACLCTRYEVLYHYGCILMEGGEGLDADPGRAAELLEEAAEAAGAAGKGKLAQRYYERAAVAQGMCE